MSSPPNALVEVLRADPARTAILLDFDGTLSPIVVDPACAAPIEGAPEALQKLSSTYAVVAVVSGRPVSYLRSHLQESLVLVGLYGIEEASGDSVGTHPGAARWRSIVDDVAARAAEELPVGVGVEHKGLSLTLHVRAHPELAPVVEAWASQASSRSGLEVRRARMSTELHPPVATDKGTAVEALLGEVDVACFIGDDVGDLPAFDALDRFAEAGGTAVRFVVESPETDPRLRQRADALLAGPPAVLDLLRALTG
ncbi:MAG: trehalose-phosphatase [Actinomycetota bacterium]